MPLQGSMLDAKEGYSLGTFGRIVSIARQALINDDLSAIVEPRLDAVSATAWYLATDPSLVDTLEYAYLDSDQQRPELFREDGFETDGTSIKCRLNFGCGVLDWRGLYRNAGA